MSIAVRRARALIGPRSSKPAGSLLFLIDTLAGDYSDTQRTSRGLTSLEDIVAEEILGRYREPDSYYPRQFALPDADQTCTCDTMDRAEAESGSLASSGLNPSVDEKLIIPEVRVCPDLA